MNAAAATPFLRSMQAAVPSAGGEPAWLAAARATALHDFTARGLPDTHNELWKYTALRALQQVGFTITAIRDVTPIPHNGVRPSKRRRV